MSGITTLCCKCILATLLPALHPPDAAPAHQAQPDGHWAPTPNPRTLMLLRIIFANTHLCRVPRMGNIHCSPAPVSAAARRAAAVISCRSNLPSGIFGEYITEVRLISLTAVSPLRSLHNLWPKVIYLALFICPLKCLDSPSVDPVKGGHELSNRFMTLPRTLLGKSSIPATQAGHVLQFASGQMSLKGSKPPRQVSVQYILQGLHI